MRLQVAWGRQIMEVDVLDQNLVASRRPVAAPPITDLAGAVHKALEEPLRFPALRRALTPDDHVAIAVDERLPYLPQLLVPLLEHICSAGVSAEAISLVCQPPSTGQPWALDLPDEFQDVNVEVHQPAQRRKLSYLATTRHGRRIYLNRSAVDADQLILLTGRGYDPRLGISGAETALFPGLSDEATLQEFATKLSLDAPGAEPWPIQTEAVEVAWLLGAPFLVQVIEGTDGEVIHVLAGTLESSGEGQRLMEARWRIQVERPADVVLAGIGGDPDRHTFADLAHAFYCAARVVKPGGRIVLTTDANPALGRSAELLRQYDDPLAALKILLEEKPPDLADGFLWASAADRAKLYLLSRLPGDVVEEMFVTPLEQPGEVEKLVGSATCLVLPDANKALAVLPSSNQNPRV
jgi:nickel-dependent lactate racemase